MFQLTPQSTVGELPSYGIVLDWSRRGEDLGEIFRQQPLLPGVVVADEGRVRGVISRGQYLRLVGRYLGHEVYHPRPIRNMFAAIEKLDNPLVLATETPIQEAVSLALRRPRELIYEPVIVQNAAKGSSGMDFCLVDFPDLLMADSRISALRNQQMQQILATVQEGFLMIERNLRLATEYSASAERIFGRKDLGGRLFPDLLAELFDVERAELGREYLETLFDPNVIERWVAEINPLRKVAAKIGQEIKYLDFRFVRSVVGGEIRRLLVRVDDVSREILAAQELAEQERRQNDAVELTFALLEQEGSTTESFLGQCDEVLTHLEKTGQVSDLPHWARRLHGLKGEAGLCGFKPFQRLLHRLEGELLGGSERQPQLDLATELRALWRETRVLVDRLHQMGKAATPQKIQAAPPPAARLTTGLATALGETVDAACQRHQKQVRCICKIDEEILPEHYRPVLREALCQLVRNAVVHGVEETATRQAAGKNPVGTVQVVFRLHAERQQLEIIVQDDGRGLDLEAIQRRAQQLGLAGAEPESLVFAPGLSTAPQLSVDAGRGIGLDMVRAGIVELGGRVAVFHEPGVFCAFQILLPLKPGAERAAP